MKKWGCWWVSSRSGWLLELLTELIITRAVFTVKGEKSWIHETSLVHIKCLIETSLEKESFYQLYSDSDDDNDSGYTYLWWWWWMMMKQWWGCLIVTSSNQWAGIRQISLFHSGLEYLPACCALVSLTSEQAIHESLVSTNWTSTCVSFWTCTSAIYAVLRQKFHENSTKQRCRLKRSRHE